MNKIFTFLLLTVTINVFGQYTAHYEKKALSSFYSKDYEAALLYSEKVIEAEPQNISSLYVAGESARLLEDLAKAETYLEKIPDNAKLGYYAMADYRLGSVKHELAKADEAQAYYAKYLSHHDQENDLYAHLAEKALEDLKAGVKSRSRDLVELERLGDNINTDLSELAPLRYADKLYFTSTLEENFVKKNKRGKKMKQHPVTRIYEARFNGSPRPIEVNPSKATVNASNVALMPDASRMYYTLCKDDDYRNQEECEIWYRDKTYDGDWGPAVRLPQHINLRGYSTTQPTIGYDQHLKRYVLYFASNRPGGKGGMDIWASTLDWMGEVFGEPVNISINTEGDEVTPFYHQASQTFFFSSNGMRTQGGLDIFRVKKDFTGEWKTPENLGELVNTAYDDLYYTFHTNTKNAYFVSDRPGSNCKKESERGINCTDIYQARIFVDVELDFFSARDRKEVWNASVEMEDLDSGRTSVFDTDGKNNHLRVRLEPGKNYLFKVKARGYHDEVIEVNTEGFSFVTTLEQEVLLQKKTARP
jgi:tetratricopeptide (TPR) repeat protein